MTGLSLCERLPLLVADNQHLVVIELGKTCEHRCVIAKSFVAVELHKLIEDKRKIVARLGTIRMPSDFNSLPGIKITENLLLRLDELSLQASQFLLLLCSQWRTFQCSYPIFDFIDRFFQWQSVEAARHTSTLQKLLGPIGQPRFSAAATAYVNSNLLYCQHPITYRQQPVQKNGWIVSFSALPSWRLVGQRVSWPTSFE